MGIDLKIFSDLYIHADEITAEIIAKLKEWVDLENSKKKEWCDYNWTIEYIEEQCIILKTNEHAKGTIEDYTQTLVMFLKECSKYEIYMHESVPYLMAWGDWESGALYINSSEKIAKIVGVCNFGQTSERLINWDLTFEKTTV